MLSSSFNITEFMEKIKGHSYQEIIWLTDREATEAERCLCKAGHQEDSHESDKIIRYAGCLKDLILYMRHGIRKGETKKLKMDYFRDIRLQH